MWCLFSRLLRLRHLHRHTFLLVGLECKLLLELLLTPFRRPQWYPFLHLLLLHLQP